MPMIRFTHIAWALLLMALLALFAVTGSVALFAFAIALLTAPFLGLLAVSYASRRISASIESPTVSQKSTEVTCALVLRNPTAMPFARVQCVVRVYNMLTGQTARCTLRAAVPPHAEARVSFAFDSDVCGRLDCRIEKLRIYVPFCLFGRTRPSDTVRRLSVMPQLYDARLRNTLAAAPLSDTMQFSPNFKGQDLSEVFSLRDYEPGDDLRRIHWKLSEKMEGLVVREPSLPIDNSILVFWDKGLYGSDADPLRADAMAEVMLAVCEHLSEDGVPYEVAMNDIDHNRCLREFIEDENDIYELIGHLMSSSLGIAGESGIEMYLRLFGALSCARMIYVSSGLPTELVAMNRNRQIMALICDDADDIRIEPGFSEIHFRKGDALSALTEAGVV